jgi:hypothetical protein
VVTFNELGSITNQDRFWGKEFFGKLGIASIGVITPKPNWYPAEEIAAAIEAINFRAKGRRIVTYGHSQGGYGAIKFSAALGASAALSFCPQWSIAPDEVGHFDRRFVRFYDASLNNGRKIRPADISPNTFIFLDPFEGADVLNADLIDSPATSRVIAPFTGHETVRIMAETDAGSEIFTNIKENRLFDKMFFRNIIRKYRGASVSYKRNRYLHLLKNLPKSRELMIRHIQVSESQRAIIELVCAIKAGQHDKLAMLISSISEDDLAAAGVIGLWKMFRDSDFLTGELLVAEIISKRFSHDAFYRLHVVNIFIKAGRADDARNELLAIVGRFGIGMHGGHIERFATILGCAEDLKSANPALE